MQLTQPANPTGTPSPQPPPVLRAVGVDVVLGGVPIIRKADLLIQPGEAVAIMGNNGSGKTTLMRATLGLVPHQGLIELFGTPLQDFRDWPRIGYVPQRSGILVQQATAREVVASGRLARRRPFTPATAADRKAIAAALERVDLADRANHPFVRLSGGQQQRVLIARALATGAELMMWDEPLAGVDHATQALLADLAAALKADGVTIVMVLHELGSFEPVIDRAISLAEGRVIASGPLPRSHTEGHEVAELKPTRLHRTGLEAV